MDWHYFFIGLMAQIVGAATGAAMCVAALLIFDWLASKNWRDN